jgi:hypothetical protein
VFSNDSAVSGQFAYLLLRMRRALRISCFFLGGISRRSRLHLLDLLGVGGAAAEQVPGRVGRADEGGDLLPFVPVRPRLGGHLRGQRAGAHNGPVRAHHRLPLQVGAYRGGRRGGAGKAPLQARAYGGGRRRRAREVLQVPEKQGSHAAVLV